ncbi:MAG: hypothetical protein Q8R55_02330 [Candidatus Taylorbacteria bacterium]|nr:hypothetical protein [Candidatus Taylorbacteria bacterium]
MEKRELQKQFINSVILLIKIQNLVKDNFFYNGLTGKIFAFSFDFLEFLTKESEGDIAQCQISAERCLANISELTGTFKEFRYLGLVKNAPLLLKAEYNLLSVKLGILKRMKERSSTLDLEKGRTSESLKTEPSRDSTPDLQKDRTSASLKAEPRISYRTDDENLTPSKKKILEYIRSYPNTRTKDIIYEFSALSGRSVKRNLTDLLRTGLVKKRVDSKAVYYYANEVQ